MPVKPYGLVHTVGELKAQPLAVEARIVIPKGSVPLCIHSRYPYFILSHILL